MQKLPIYNPQNPPTLISAIQACMGLANKTLIVTVKEIATHLVHIKGSEQEYDLWLMQVTNLK
jgi:hypothetical protein